MAYKYLMILIATCTTVVYFIPYACNDFYNHFIDTYHITYGQAGDLLTFFGITAVIGYFIGGWVADKFNPKMLVVWSAILTGLAGTVVAFSTSFTILKIMYFLFGITSTCMHWSAFLKVIKNIGEDDEQGKLFGFYNFSYGLFGIVVFGILTWIFVPYDEEKAKAKEGADDKIDLKLIGKVLKMPITWYLGLFTLGYFLVRSTVPYLNPYMTDAFGVSIGIAALVTNTLRSGMNLIAGPVGGFFIDRLKSSTKVVMVGGIGTLLFTIVLMLVPQQHNMIILLITVCIILLLFSYVNSTALYTPVTEARVPFKYVGTVLGVASAIGYSSDIWLYNLCGTWLDNNGNAGYSYIWLLQAFGAIMMIVMGLLLAATYKKVRKNGNQTES